MPCGTVPKGDDILSQINSTRNGCKDVFHAFLVKNATDSGKYKIINASKSEYETDGKETAKLIFRRDKK